MSDNWILLKTFPNHGLASIAQGYLEEQGIKTVIVNKKDRMYQVFGEVELFCHIQQAHEAVDLLEKIEDE